MSKLDDILQLIKAHTPQPQPDGSTHSTSIGKTDACSALDRAKLREQLEEIALGTRSGSTKGRHVTAVFDMVQLTKVVSYLLAQDRQARDTQAAKAYGGCKNCFGKGYATVNDRWYGHDTDTDIGSPGGYVSGGNPNAMKFCACDRGKQLERRFEEAAKAKELAVLDARIQGATEALENMAVLFDKQPTPEALLTASALRKYAKQLAKAQRKAIQGSIPNESQN